MRAVNAGRRVIQLPTTKTPNRFVSNQRKRLDRSMATHKTDDVQVQWNLFTEKKHTQDYALFRPNYPQDLIENIFVSFPNGYNDQQQPIKIVDIGCGSGQLTLQLGQYLHTAGNQGTNVIIGLDPSANQIENAKDMMSSYPELQNLIEYRVSSAEETGIESGTVDLITVAQALHWFDLDKFFAEVNRLLKPNGELAVLTYDLNQFDIPEAQQELLELYNGVLGKYWSPKRRMVDEKYATVSFPYPDTLQRFVFPLHKTMTVQNYINYLNTWSAVQKYRQENPVNTQEEDILEKFKHRLMPKLNVQTDQDMVQFTWPMYLITVKKNE